MVLPPIIFTKEKSSNKIPVQNTLTLSLSATQQGEEGMTNANANDVMYMLYSLDKQPFSLVDRTTKVGGSFAKVKGIAWAYAAADVER